ncbi:MAG: magnesium transporter CorA family protein [Deltaproteobacteria bacterium]|jgi:magnesium transporter|nr:magnesium transporter CorA family protein [Deltaproteobacteria bacterium]
MIKNYILDDTSWLETSMEEEANWVDLEGPNTEELLAVAERYNLPPLFLSDPLDPRERPRLDDEDEAILIIVRAPCVHKELNAVFSTIPIGIIITPRMILTVCREPGLARQLLSRETRKPRVINRQSLLFKILIEISSDFIHQLEVLEDLAEEAERHLSKSQQNEQLMTLLTIEKALINFSVALHSNRSIMEKLKTGATMNYSDEQAGWLDHALIENQQAVFTVEIFGQIVGSMGDAFGVIISNNLNKVMKFLTGVTIILMVPTLIVGAYGMNVRLPLAEFELAFYILAFLCLASSLVILLYFNRRKWL